MAEPFDVYTDSKVVWESESLGLTALPGGWEFVPGYRLASTLPVQLKISASGILATTHLETTEEYGWGSMTGEAIMDLLSSLVEYMESLEDRKDRLGEPALLDLDKLHQLLERSG